MPPIAARSPSAATKFSDIGNAAGDAAGRSALKDVITAAIVFLYGKHEGN